MRDDFLPDQPEYDIEILEWLTEEDYTPEWEYIWKVKAKEPIYFLILGGYIQRLNRAFIYERVLTQSGYDDMKKTGRDHGPFPLPAHILTDCPEDDDVCKEESPEESPKGLIARHIPKWRKGRR